MDAKKIKLEVDLSQYDSFGLCYVDRNVCYFTSQDIREQWGDDWDDAPYEHNAGTPYTPTVYHLATGEKKLSGKDWQQDGTPRYQLLKLYFEQPEEASIEAPCERTYEANSPWDVRSINAGECPWLVVRGWSKELKTYEEREALQAGASPRAFYEFLKRNGGSLLIPDKGVSPYPEPMPGAQFYGD